MICILCIMRMQVRENYILRPIINLKTEEGNHLFRTIAEEIATLVKKYNGSLSGEHGDGRLRGEFIKQMVGEKNYRIT